MTRELYQVAIIGGGITGLSAAYYIEKRIRENGLNARCVLLEADSQLGGKVQTKKRDGFVMEKGPDSFLARKRAAVNLIRELGMEQDLVGTNPAGRKSYILHKGELHRIPAGLSIGVPTQFVPFATTKLLSMAGKVRAGFDLLLPRGLSGDQSLGQFLERRLGKEVVDRIAEPLLAGIYAGDLRKLSLRATFPQYETLERKYGSLIRGMLAQAKAEKTPAQNEQGGVSEGGSVLPQSAFLSLKGGLSQLVNRLAESLQLTDIHTLAKVESIEICPEGYRVNVQNGDPVAADAVVLTAPAYEVAKVLGNTMEADPLEKIPYVSVATVILAYPQDEFNFPLAGSGFVVPRSEGRTITACTWVSNKWLHTAPPGHVLIRCYVGRSGDESIVDESDEEIIKRVRHDLAEVMQIQSEPLFSLVTRWKQAMPQYTVGHLDRIEAFRDKAAAKHPGLFFGGAGFTGLGIPDCIVQGEQLSNQVLTYLISLA
ncbi:MAG: protoporphyrinogen oxidase [Bacilli bacterium]|nr:protoporphyrinogen oxidase [Bacilli bacterium]